MLDNSDRAILSTNSKLITFNHNEKIIKKNDTDKTVYMMKSGIAQAVIENGTIVLTYKVGMIFGERAITENKTRSIDIISQGNVQVYAFDPNSFLKI